jgi:hypothetical protein
MKKAILSATAVAVLVLGCFKGEVTTPVETYPAPTTPVNVLKNVEIAFNRGDINLLKAMLSPNFVFYFDPRDVGQSPPGSHYVIPESWSYTGFWCAAQNMFRQAYSISLSIPTGQVGTPGEHENAYKADYISISLLVMLDELNGYRADGGYCNFEFEKYTAEDGKKYWRLTGWWDRTAAFNDEYTGVAPTSLGRILALFS